jgi:hypothetical protein
MRSLSLANMALAACVIGTASCATLPATPSPDKQVQSQDATDPVKDLFGFLRGVVNSVLPTKEKELKRLVDTGSYQAAADYWVANKEDLSKSTTARPLVQAISVGLGNMHATEAAQHVAALQVVMTTPAGKAPWVSAPTEWPGMKNRMAAAEKLAQSVGEHPFFVANPPSVPPSIQGLNDALSAARTKMHESAAYAFVAYDHRSTVPFFDAFPISLDSRTQSALAVRGSALWLKALLGGTEEQARTAAKAYAGYIRAPEARLMIASAYAGVVARERKWSDQRSLQQVVQLMQALDAAGLDSSMAARGVKIGILRGLNPQADGFRWTPNNRAASAMDAQDLPIGALNDWAREVASIKPNQIYVLIDPSRTSAMWQLASLTPRAGERQVGQRASRNPEWDRARQEAEDARREYADAERMNQQTQLQAQQLAAQSAGSSLGALGAMLGATAGAMSVSSAKRRMSDAESTFASTPETLTVAVTRPYQSALASFDAIRERETAIYVVHGARGQFFKLDINDTNKLSDQIVFGIDPTDTGFAAVTARNRAVRERFRQFAANAPYASADEVWNKLTGATEVPVTPISRLAQTVRDDHRRWSKSAASERVRAQSSTQQLEERVLKIVEGSK